jgi:hypothetical protein
MTEPEWRLSWHEALLWLIKHDLVVSGGTRIFLLVRASIKRRVEEVKTAPSRSDRSRKEGRARSESISGGETNVGAGGRRERERERVWEDSLIADPAGVTDEEKEWIEAICRNKTALDCSIFIKYVLPPLPRSGIRRSYPQNPSF